jgi:hypothetical protein
VIAAVVLRRRVLNHSVEHFRTSSQQNLGIMHNGKNI